MNAKEAFKNLPDMIASCSSIQVENDELIISRPAYINLGNQIEYVKVTDSTVTEIGACGLNILLALRENFEPPYMQITILT